MEVRMKVEAGNEQYRVKEAGTYGDQQRATWPLKRFIEDQSNRSAGIVLALQVVDLGFIPGVQYDPLSTIRNDS